MKNKFKIGLGMLVTLTGFSTLNAQIFKKNADSFPVGTYTRDQLINDWQTTSGNGFSKRGRGEDRVTVVRSSAPDTGNALKVKYPKGKADSKESGAQWETDLKGEYNELYLSYDVKFSADFEFVKPQNNKGRTGKLPGLGGGLNFDDKDDRNTAWDGKLQFRDKDELEFYVKTPVNNDKHFTWKKASYTIKKNKWFNIEIRYKLNTVGQKNGIMQAWVDGKLLGEYKNAEFRDNARVKINKMFFSTFYGGNPEADAPTKDVYAYFDNFVVDTKRINNTLSSVSTSEPTSSNSSNNTPNTSNSCKGSQPQNISSKIQAENYCKIKGATNKNSYVNFSKNDFVEYYVSVPTTGNYEVKYRVATNKNSGRGKVRFRLSGTNKGDVSIPKTGGNTKWRTIKKTMRLEKGKRTIRIQAMNGGGWNLDYFEIKSKSSNKQLASETLANTKLTVYPNPSKSGIFNLSQNSKWTIMSLFGNIIATGEGNQINLSNQASGLYLLKTDSSINKIIIQ